MRQLLDGAVKNGTVVAENVAERLLGDHHIGGLSEEAHVDSGGRIVGSGCRLDWVVAARCPTNSTIFKEKNSFGKIRSFDFNEKVPKKCVLTSTDDLSAGSNSSRSTQRPQNLERKTR